MHISPKMHSKLESKLNQFFIQTGKGQGKIKLAIALGRTVPMIDRYLRGDSRLKPDLAHKLALFLGCDDSEALEIATEIANERKASA